VRSAEARQQGLTEEKISSLDKNTPQGFTPREQIALRFAELMALDHHKIDDAFFFELKRHFSEAEIVELGVSIALNLGFGRFTAALGVEPW
jgi:alkylhydroperoxidase family enzyme